MSFIKQNSDLKDKLDIYEGLLIKWSASLNLVAKSTLSNIRARHFEDSLQLMPFLSPQDDICDVGTGAGFPGMVLAMCGYNVTLIDSDQKKCVFLENVSRETKTPVKIICSRIESFKSDKKFDVICSRGVSSLSSLIQLTSHLAKTNQSKGLFLKGENVDTELSQVSLERFTKHRNQLNPNSYIVEYQY